MSRCSECSGGLSGPAARWCPRCGALLDSGTPAGPEAPVGSGPTPSPAPRGPGGTLEAARRAPAGAILLLVAVLLVTAVVSRTGAGSGPADDPGALGGAATRVELPDRAAVSDGSGSSGGDGTTGESGASSTDDATGGAGGPSCAQVSGCLAWRTVLPDPNPPAIPALAIAGELVIVGGSDGLSGVDTATGELVWSRAWPGPPAASRSFVATPELLVVAGQGLSLYHAPTGIPLGHLPVPAVLDLTDTATFGDQVLVTLVSEIDGREQPSVLALARDDGGPRWWELADEVVLTTAGAVVLRDGELAGLDPHDGSPRWRVPAGPAGASALAGLAEAVAYRQGPGADALLIFRSGVTGQVPEPWSGRTRFRTAPDEVGRPVLGGSVLQAVVGGVLRWSVPSGGQPCCGATRRAAPLLVVPAAAPAPGWQVRDRRGGPGVTWVPVTPGAGAPGRLVLGDFSVEVAGADAPRRADLRVRDTRSGVTVAGGSGLLPVVMLEGGDLLLAGDGRLVRLSVPRR